MKLKKAEWLYVLPGDVCEIRNALIKGDNYYEAVSLVDSKDIRAWQLAVINKKSKVPKGNFVALETDEIGVNLLLFPTPKADAEMELTVMKMAIL